MKSKMLTLLIILLVFLGGCKDRKKTTIVNNNYNAGDTGYQCNYFNWEGNWQWGYPNCDGVYMDCELTCVPRSPCTPTDAPVPAPAGIVLAGLAIPVVRYMRRKRIL
jgi:hypothetical protein